MLLPMKNNTNTLFLILFIASCIFSLIAISDVSIVRGISDDGSDGVFVMYAGSLANIFENVIGPEFQSESEYTYIGEGKGSVQVANLIKDGFRTPDVFVSAGTSPVLMLMNNTPPIAEWLVEFGSAEIVIAYSTTSPYFDDLEKARKGEISWYNIVSQDGFKLGRTDPELDPKGYYAIITAKLANTYYNNSLIKDKIFGEDRNSKQIFPEETLKSTLELGQLDAVVAYKHEAISRALPYIILPKEISLSDRVYSDFYKQANYTLESTQKIIYGEPVFFSVTIPNTAKNLDGAISFVNFILSKNGSQLLDHQGLRPINATHYGDLTSIPLSIRDEITK
jgi:molybdate/tungstate transport system substrate-binding protein